MDQLLCRSRRDRLLFEYEGIDYFVEVEGIDYFISKCLSIWVMQEHMSGVNIYFKKNLNIPKEIIRRCRPKQDS